MNDHHHFGEYAEPRHDHREYADERHDHDLDYAGRHHRHHDLETGDEKLRQLITQWGEELRELRENLRGALERIRQLEQQAPDASQAGFEAGQAAATEPGYRCPDCGCADCTGEDCCWPDEAGTGRRVPRLRRLRPSAPPLDEEGDL